MEQENSNINIDTRPLMVSISCITYNHELYIRQCLEGFVMQQTNFRFEAVVHDDASTDGTAAIIREYAEKYPDIIKPIYETENQYSKHDGSLFRIMNEACKGKYIAYCEGDDYWIDPTKLQKQVDFLEAHPDYGMCWTDAYQETNKRRQAYNRYEYDCQSSLVDIIEQGGAFIPTCSIMARNTIPKSMPKELQSFFVRDYPLQMWCGYASKCQYLKEQTCVYRYLSQGSWTSQNFHKCSKETYLKYYYEQKRMYDEFNRFFEYKYAQSFEKCAANFLFNLLVWSESYDLLKPYIRLRRKYKIHIGKAIFLRAYGFTFLAKIVESCSVIKGRLTKQIKSI